MDLLSSRKDDDLAIFRAWTKRTLNKHAEKMRGQIDQEMSGFDSAFWKERSFVTTDQSLFYKHRPENRFVDMKTRNVNGVRRPKEFHQIHNKIIMGHYSGIMYDLTYGISETVKEQLRREFQNKKI